MKNRNLWESVRCAARGVRTGIKTERNFATYGLMALGIFILNVLLGFNPWEMLVFFVLVLLVLAMEFMNTALERLTDFVTEGLHPLIRDVKDLAAAAVLVSGAAFFLAEGYILLPKLVRAVRALFL